jgi:hypothetical protein
MEHQRAEKQGEPGGGEDGAEDREMGVSDLLPSVANQVCLVTRVCVCVCVCGRGFRRERGTGPGLGVLGREVRW